MAVSAERITVSMTAVALNPVESDSVAGGRLFVKNTHASDALVLGASDVTASTGFALGFGETLEIPLSFGERVYAIRGAAADITAHVLRVGG